MGTWSTRPLSEDDIKRIEEDEAYSKEYCEYCDYSMGVPEDDCFCEEHCGVIGCQGSISSERD